MKSLIVEVLEEVIDLKDKRGIYEREIVGALRAAIDAHGPITRDNVSSAAKRVIGAIKTIHHRMKGQ